MGRRKTGLGGSHSKMALLRDANRYIPWNDDRRFLIKFEVE